MPAAIRPLPVALVVAVVALLATACGGGDASAGASHSALNREGCDGAEPLSGRVFLAKQEVPLLSAPRADAPPVLNARATEIMKSPQVRTVDAAYGLEGICRVPGFVKVAIVEMDGEPRDAESGWLAAQDVRGEPSPDEAAGLVWAGGGDFTAAERETIRAGALRVLKEDANCAKVIDAARSTKPGTTFYVTCKAKNNPASYNVWF